MSVDTSDNDRSSNYQKYQIDHPFVVRRIEGFFDALARLVAVGNPRHVLDLGCGEGFDLNGVCTRSARSFYCCGLDLNPAALRVARELLHAYRFDAIEGDIYDLPLELDTFDVILCLEVLEHLEYPQAVLRDICQRYAGYCVFSVPDEPLYRLTRMLVFRRNIRQLGNHPEHINHWSRRGFVGLLSRHFVIDEVVTPFPWTMVLCHRRRGITE